MFEGVDVICWPGYEVVGLNVDISFVLILL